MFQKSQMKAKIIGMILCTVLMISFCSCQSSPATCLGGEAVCYSYCVFSDRSELATIPLIFKEKIQAASLVDYQCDDKDVFLVTEEGFDAQECYVYGDYYVYFIVLRVSVNPTDKIIHSSIDNIVVNINGTEYTLTTPNFKITNGIDGVDSVYYNDGTLLFGGTGSNTTLTPILPTKEKPAVMGITAKQDIQLNAFGVFDYFTVDYCVIDGKEISPDGLQIPLFKGDSTSVSYSLQFANGSDINHIVRAARYILFTEDGMTKAFIDGAGAYVYYHYSDIGAIKNYIDSLR